MGTITLSQINNGDSLDASVVDTNFDTLANEFNGNIEDANIKSSAAVSISKLAAVAFSSHTAVLTGFSGTPTQNNKYIKIGRLIIMDVFISGTSNDTVFTFTVPYAVSAIRNNVGFRATDNSAGILGGGGLIVTAANSTTVTAYANSNGLGWTASGTKAIEGVLIYEATS